MPDADRILCEALTTPDGANGWDGGPDDPDYKRLETLGDAVLDMIVSTHLFHKYTEENEGELTRLRSQIVSNDHLAERFRSAEMMDTLGSYVDVRLRQGVRLRTKQRDIDELKKKCQSSSKTSNAKAKEIKAEIQSKEAALSHIQYDLVESLIGAAYQIGGLPEARKMVSRFGLIPGSQGEDQGIHSGAAQITWKEALEESDSVMGKKPNEYVRRVCNKEGKGCMATREGERLEWLGDKVNKLTLTNPN